MNRQPSCASQQAITLVASHILLCGCGLWLSSLLIFLTVTQLVQQQEKIFDVLSSIVTKQNQQPACDNPPPSTTQPTSDSPSASPPPVQQSPHPQLYSYSSQPVQQVPYSQSKPQQLPVQSPLSRPVKPFYQARRAQQLPQPASQQLTPHSQQLPQQLPPYSQQIPLYSQPSSQQHSQPASFPQSPPLWSPQPAQQGHKWYTGSSNEEEPAEVIILDSTSAKTSQSLSQEPKPWTDEWDWTDNFDSDYHTSQS